MKNKFEELCESMGVLSQTRRMFYPKQIKFSDNFVKALKEEYFRQKLEEDSKMLIRNRPEKFMKAIQFHVADFEKNTAQELEAARKFLAKTQESTDQYEARVKGEKQQGSKKQDRKGLQRRKEEINKEMMGLNKTQSKPVGEAVDRTGEWQRVSSVEDAVDYITSHTEDPLLVKDNEIVNNIMRKLNGIGGPESVISFKDAILRNPSIPKEIKHNISMFRF